jgi:hypothetical protein
MSPGPTSSNTSAASNVTPQNSPSPASQNPADAPVPEHSGPVSFTRMRKDDGRALIVYSLDHEQS